MIKKISTVVGVQEFIQSKPGLWRGALATLALAALSATAHAAETWAEVRKAGELRCGSAVSAPVVLRDVRTGQYSGPFADVCKKFAEQVLKVKVTYVDTTWDNIVAGVQTGKWDLAMALNKTPDREQAITFSAPVAHSATHLIYYKANPKLSKQTQAIADIDKANLTVAVMQGSSIDKDVTKVFKTARILRLPDADSVRLAFLSRRADMLADTTESNAIFSAAHPGLTAEFLPEPSFPLQEMGFGVGKSISAADLAELNQFIEAQKKSGAVQASFDAAAKQSAKEAQK